MIFTLDIHAGAMRIGSIYMMRPEPNSKGYLSIEVRDGGKTVSETIYMTLEDFKKLSQNINLLMDGVEDGGE